MKIRAFSARQIALLAEQHALCRLVVKKWNYKYPKAAGRSGDIAGQAEQAVEYQAKLLWLSAALALPALLTVLSSVAGDHVASFVLGGATLFFALLCLVPVSHTAIVSIGPYKFGSLYAQFLFHCDKRSGDIAALSDAALSNLVEERMVAAAKSVICAETAARANPQRSDLKGAEDDAKDAIKHRFNTFFALGLIPDPNSGHTPYFKKAGDELRIEQASTAA